MQKLYFTQTQPGFHLSSSCSNQKKTELGLDPKFLSCHDPSTLSFFNFPISLQLQLLHLSSLPAHVSLMCGIEAGCQMLPQTSSDLGDNSVVVKLIIFVMRNLVGQLVFYQPCPYKTVALSTISSSYFVFERTHFQGVFSDFELLKVSFNLFYSLPPQDPSSSLPSSAVERNSGRRAQSLGASKGSYGSRDPSDMPRAIV